MPVTRATKPRRRVARRKVGRRVARRRMPIGRMPKTTTGNFASTTEQFSLAITAGVVYDFKFNLTDLVRSKVMADLYQYYRISSVEMRFKPLTDTYQSGGPAYIPYLNFQYDKSGALEGTMNANNFEQIGTKAIRLDDKTIIRKWRPSVLTDGAGNLGVAQFKVAPWLPTQFNANPNVLVDHYGATFYISKQAASDGTVYDVDVVVNVQFRKPYIAPAEGATAINPPRITQGNLTAVDISLNPHLVS